MQMHLFKPNQKPMFSGDSTIQSAVNIAIEMTAEERAMNGDLTIRQEKHMANGANQPVSASESAQWPKLPSFGSESLARLVGLAVPTLRTKLNQYIYKAQGHEAQIQHIADEVGIEIVDSFVLAGIRFKFERQSDKTFTATITDHREELPAYPDIAPTGATILDEMIIASELQSAQDALTYRYIEDLNKMEKEEIITFLKGEESFKYTLGTYRKTGQGYKLEIEFAGKTIHITTTI